LFEETEKIQKPTWNLKEIQITISILKRGKKTGELTFSDFKTYYKHNNQNNSTAIKTDKNVWNRLETLEINPAHMFKLSTTKLSIPLTGEKRGSSKNAFEKTGHPHAREHENGHLVYTTFKN
jgi:hypothetical protein